MEKKCENCRYKNLDDLDSPCVDCWCHCHFLEEELKPVITNRQWLEGLSDEELAKKLLSDICQSCEYRSEYCSWEKECYKYTLDWLQAEHKE